MTKEIKFTYERDTKRTYRFTEDSDDPSIGVLYVKKTLFKSQPSEVKVTLEWES